jgi:phosphatidylglycerophosphate synthase
MTATKLIAFRVLVAAVAVGVFPFSAGSALASIVLLLFVEFIDMVDGLLAEYKGHRKPFGGFLDISADQLIETLYLVPLPRVRPRPDLDTGVHPDP